MPLPGSGADRRVSFVLGDVSGQGIAAALLIGLIYGRDEQSPWGSGEDDAHTRWRSTSMLSTVCWRPLCLVVLVLV